MVDISMACSTIKYCRSVTNLFIPILVWLYIITMFSIRIFQFFCSECPMHDVLESSNLVTLMLIESMFLQDIFGVILGGILGHSLCTGLAVIGGRIIAQKISIRTGMCIYVIIFDRNLLVFLKDYTAVFLMTLLPFPQQSQGGSMLKWACPAYICIRNLFWWTNHIIAFIFYVFSLNDMWLPLRK